MALTLAEYKLICARGLDEGVVRSPAGILRPLHSGQLVALWKRSRDVPPHSRVRPTYSDIVLLSRSLPAGHTEAIRAGARDYLIKPVIPDELRRAVARLISVPPETAIEARRAGSAAIREELAIRHTENVELIERAKKKYLLARMKAIRLRAEMAFLAAGGTRGAFAREWLSGIFRRSVRRRYAYRCERPLNTNARRLAGPR